MKIVVDEDIPYAYELFGRLGEVKSIPGRSISKEALRNADALMIRSVTKVTRELLSDTTVKFVGTATSGVDHVDRLWLEQSGIRFAHASGCNAIAVVEYIFSALLVLAERNRFSIKDRTVGIVGVGNIGNCLKKYLEALEIRTLLCDPPRADRGEKEDFRSLDELVELSDILTFHTPLCLKGVYKTLYLADEKLISRLKPGSILINTCRGPVVDNKMLLTRLEAGQNLIVVLDVWEKEPDVNPNLLRKIDIGTAHIAGHTLEGRLRGTIRLFEAYSFFIKKPQQIKFDEFLPIPDFDSIHFHGFPDELSLKRLVHLIYDVRRDDAVLRTISSIPDKFDELRKNYIVRREWSSLCIECDQVDSSMLLNKLGFHAIHNISK